MPGMFYSLASLCVVSWYALNVCVGNSAWSMATSALLRVLVTGNMENPLHEILHKLYRSFRPLYMLERNGL